jgi:hypothetical protein
MQGWSVHREPVPLKAGSAPLAEWNLEPRVKRRTTPALYAFGLDPILSGCSPLTELKVSHALAQ